MKKLIPLALLLLVCALVYRFPLAVGAVGADEPLCVVTHVDVIPPFTAAGRDLLKQFAVDSRKDAGAIRIEVLEELSRPNHSTVVEIWSGKKAYDDHLAVDHTRAFRAKLQPMLGSPFDERLHHFSSADAAH
jgi:quinol monooxygenase YgiN